MEADAITAISTVANAPEFLGLHYSFEDIRQNVLRKMPQILAVRIDALSTRLAAGSRDAISAQGHRNAFVDVCTPDVTL
jgi:hypothetical protein